MKKINKFQDIIVVQMYEMVNKLNFVNYIIKWKSISLHKIHALNIFQVQILLVMSQLKRLVTKK
jgi:hypothetical protein